jgi:tRNA(Met) cytidine acetyltransferase
MRGISFARRRTSSFAGMRACCRPGMQKRSQKDSWEATLNNDDWLELAGFAFAHRAFSTSVAALTRLLLTVDMPLPALRGKMDGKTEDVGRKALLATLRSETAQAIECLDYPRCQQLKEDILQWQFFQ